MTLDPQITSELDQTIGVKMIKSRDRGGTITYNTTLSISARVVAEADSVESPSGKMIATTHKIITETQILDGATIWLPGDSTSDATLGREARKIESSPDEFGSTGFYVVTV